MNCKNSMDKVLLVTCIRKEVIERIFGIIK